MEEDIKELEADQRVFFSLGGDEMLKTPPGCFTERFFS